MLISSVRKELCVQEEPEFEELLVSGSSLVVLVSACADFVKVSYPIEQIIFPPTIIHQVFQCFNNYPCALYLCLTNNLSR